MLKQEPIFKRSLPVVQHQGDLVVIGGGLSGVCCAVTAARAGCSVVLVQDRPVLGGNASSEVRLWVLGATSHMGNNNRWAREGGVIDEILVENMYRNPEGNPIIFDAVLLDKVINETNITLLLNSAVYEVEKNGNDTIHSLKAFCSQNQTTYHITAPLFCDASGDGIVGFLAGAAFRMGAESQEEFGEKFAPTKEYGELLGHSLYFYTKDTGKPVNYVAPSFALKDITEIPRFKSFNTKEFGCKLWWIEYGGRLDTVHQTEEIKWELWKIVYGVWDYIKNSGNFSDSQNLTLEWVGMIPGKRESRRFEGDYLLKQQDVINQHQFDDAVAYGGWSIDLHPADGIFSEKPGCNQWHSKGIYSIPYRCFYSKNINNLFIAGRIISATHVAFGSSRVMATGAYGAQAVGLAASICSKNKLTPREVLSSGLIQKLQQELIKTGQYLPGIKLNDEHDFVQSATLAVSSTLTLQELPEDASKILDESVAQMIPVAKGAFPEVNFHVYSTKETSLIIELRKGLSVGNYTPELVLESKAVNLQIGKNCINLKFDTLFKEDDYAYLIFHKNTAVKIATSNTRVTGVLSLFNTKNEAVSNNGRQSPKDDIGVDNFEFWTPKRRPDGENIALKFNPGLAVFEPANIKNGFARPTNQPNAWVAGLQQKQASLQLAWEQPQTIKRIELSFDTDFDHPMESVLMSHPENVMPFCVRNYELLDDKGLMIYTKLDNYQTRNTVVLEDEILTKQLILRLYQTDQNIPISLFEIRCYNK